MKQSDNQTQARQHQREAIESPYPFEPLGEGINITAGPSSTVTALPLVLGERALVTNWGVQPAFIRFGDATTVATTASLCILPGLSVLLTVPLLGDYKPQATHVAALSPAGTSIQISLGNGV